MPDGSRTRTTYTYALVEVDQRAWDQVASVLTDAGYDHAISDGVIDMHGLALVVKEDA